MEQYEIKIPQLRLEIENIDDEILALLNKRVDIAKEIGLIKKCTGQTIYNPVIEQKKIEYLKEYSKHKGLVETIWPIIMCYCRAQQMEEQL